MMKSERKRNLYKALVKEHGKKNAYDMYGEFIDYRKRTCLICKSSIDEYSEWQDTGYELEACENGCYSIETWGSTTELQTKGFSFHGRVSETMYWNFEQQIKINAKTFKQDIRLFWRKKKSQKKNK